MQTGFSYYDILGIEPTATQEEIRLAYRAAVLKYHPDVNSAPNAQRLTSMLNDAYEVLRDVTKRRAYDDSLSRGETVREPGEPAEEEWVLFTCDRCGKIDPHLRFALFFKVWSIVIFSRMAGVGGVLCPQCRSHFAWTTALFSACLGPWGFPWGIIYTIRSLFAAVRGGEMKRLENGQLLRHLGIAFGQRGYNNAAKTAFIDSLRFEKNSAIIDMLTIPNIMSADLIKKPGWLRGQTAAAFAFAIPFILLFIVFGTVAASDESNRQSSTTQQSSTGSTTSAGQDASSQEKPAPEPTVTMSPCLDKSSKLEGRALYDACKEARATYAQMRDAATTGTDRDDYAVLEAMAEIVGASGANDARMPQATQMRDEAVATFKQMKDSASDPRAKQMAKRYYDCYAQGSCK